MQDDKEDYLHTDFLQPSRSSRKRDMDGYTFRHHIVLPGFSFGADGNWRVWVETDLDGEITTRGAVENEQTTRS